MSDDTGPKFDSCPFCGTAPEVLEIGNGHGKRRAIKVRCPGCRIERTDAILNGRGFSIEWLREAAAKNWNQRAQHQLEVAP